MSRGLRALLTGFAVVGGAFLLIAVVGYVGLTLALDDTQEPDEPVRYVETRTEGVQEVEVLSVRSTDDIDAWMAEQPGGLEPGVYIYAFQCEQGGAEVGRVTMTVLDAATDDEPSASFVKITEEGVRCPAE